jgi:DNA-binding LytR/AlgR family response regulator
VFVKPEQEKALVAVPSGGGAKEQPLILCIKSYGDYRYIDARDILLLTDNNSTDIHLNSGEMVTAFKTLKHFEGAYLSFVRIHNSYIVNTAYISRITPVTRFVISKKYCCKVTIQQVV